MDANKIRELADDPVFWRDYVDVVDKIKDVLANGRDSEPKAIEGKPEGMPTTTSQFRDVTQDRPSPHVPTYEMPGRGNTEATNSNLAWHYEVSKAAGTIVEAQKEMEQERSQTQGQENVQQNDMQRERSARSR